MTFRAIKEIQPGEEVTISYIDLAATTHERRSDLVQHYRFDPISGSGDPLPFLPGDSFLWTDSLRPSLPYDTHDTSITCPVTRETYAVRVVTHAAPYVSVFASAGGELDRSLVTARTAGDGAELAMWGEVSRGASTRQAEEDFDVDFAEAERDDSRVQSGCGAGPSSNGGSGAEDTAAPQHTWSVTVHVFRGYVDGSNSAVDAQSVRDSAVAYAQVLIVQKAAERICADGDSAKAFEGTLRAPSLY